MKRHSVILFGALLLGAACSHEPSPATQDVSKSVPTEKSAKTYDESVPPTKKQVLRALIENQQVALSVDQSCAGVGTEQTDVNIGDYISGFLAEQSSEKGKNWLEITSKPRPSSGPVAEWDCRVVIRHLDGDDRWGWGVSFRMQARDHSVVGTTFRCTGSG